MASIVHIKICEAHKLLKVCDSFVKVYLDSNKKSVKKTKPFKNTADPAWNDEFEFNVQDPNDKVVFHVYEEGNKAHEELAKKVSVPLTDFKVGDPPKSITLNLVLKKKDAGTLNTEICLIDPKTRSATAAVEEKERKPIQLNVKLVKATQLHKMDKIGKSDPYCIFQLKGYPQDQLSRWKSETKKNTLDPVWDESHDFMCKDWNTDVLVFQMWDKDVIKDDQMVDDIEFRINQFPLNKRVTWSEDVKHKNKPGGHLDLEFEVIDLLDQPKVQNRDFVLDEVTNPEGYSFSLGTYSSSYATSFSSITCSHQLSDLHSSEKNDHKHHTLVQKTSSPKPTRLSESISGVLIGCKNLIKIGAVESNTYAVIHVLSKALYQKKGKPAQKSDIVNNSSDPVYNLVFDYQKVSKGDSLQVEVYQTNTPKGEVLIGESVIPLKNINENQTCDQEIKLEKPRKFPDELGNFDNFGTVQLSLTHNVQYQ